MGVSATSLSTPARWLLGDFSGRKEHTLLAPLVCLVLPISTLYRASGHLIVGVSCFSAGSVLALIVYHAVIVSALRAGLPSPAVRR